MDDYQIEYEDKTRGVKICFKGDKERVDEIYTMLKPAFEESIKQKPSGLFVDIPQNVVPPAKASLVDIQKQTSETGATEVPILDPKPEGIRDFIRQIFKTAYAQKGLDTGELAEIASINGLFGITADTIASTTKQLFDKREIRRQKHGAKYHYFPNFKGGN